MPRWQLRCRNRLGYQLRRGNTLGVGIVRVCAYFIKQLLLALADKANLLGEAAQRVAADRAMIIGSEDPRAICRTFLCFSNTQPDAASTEQHGQLLHSHR